MVINPTKNSKEKALLIDIGGTNIRTCKAYIGDKKLHDPLKKSISCLKDFDSLVKAYLSEDPDVRHLVISVAGPKLNNSITMTNRDFKINERDILNKFDIDTCEILNDWESIGHSLRLFNNEDINFINDGSSFNNVALMIGPGTGLGAAIVINDNMVLPTEVGNTSSMLSGLLKGIDIDEPNSFNVVEDLISGKGIERIYSHLASDKKSPEEIIDLCRDKDRFAIETIELFIDSMAYLLSELALTYLPGKGIFLAGGLARSLQEFIYSENFNKNFLRNRRSMHVNLLSEIPIGIIQKQMTCLHGNLAFLSDKLRS